MPNLDCNQCNKKIYKTPSRTNKTNFCDIRCYNSYRYKNKNKVTCYKCKKIVFRVPYETNYRHNFCSFACKNSFYKTGEKNHNWKGDGVGYIGLHGWVKRNLKKPKKCQDCKKEKGLDLANISQEYKRDLDDWEWLCRRCHMIKDGRTKNAIMRMKNQPCKLCQINGCMKKHSGHGYCEMHALRIKRNGSPYIKYHKDSILN
jgi:hypothetical protein